MMTIALPKGRLQERAMELFSARGCPVTADERTLVVENRDAGLRFVLVKNSDLPTYVSHGIAGIGICGDDVIYESGYQFLTLMTMPFGRTRICLAGREGDLGVVPTGPHLKVATKFVRFTRDFFHARGISVQIIRLNGSVELAPILGLAPYIVDLVETGSTLKANRLAVLEELAPVSVRMIANFAYYKVHCNRIDALVARLQGGDTE